MAAANYITLADVNEALPNTDLGTNDVHGTPRTQLATDLCTRVSRAIDLYTHREPGAYAVAADDTRYFDGLPSADLWGRPKWEYGPGVHYPSLYIGEIATDPTSVAVTPNGDPTNYQVWNASDFFMEPFNSPSFAEPYTHVTIDILNGGQRTFYWYKRGVRVIGKFGFSILPPDPIKQACLILVGRWLKRAELAYADRYVPTHGTAPLAYLKSEDQDVAMLVEPYRKRLVKF